MSSATAAPNHGHGVSNIDLRFVASKPANIATGRANMVCFVSRPIPTTRPMTNHRRRSSVRSNRANTRMATAQASWSKDAV